MNIEQFRDHCLALKGVTESTPFLNPNIVAFKVMGKMFCMLSLASKDGVIVADLKSDPQQSVELRERYKGITSGHVPSSWMWNRIVLESDVPDELIVELIAHAVDEVIKKLSKAQKKEYELL